jgi:uncharacterized glyoxalase superfamily protein PhnB
VADFPQIAPMLSYEDVGAAADWLVAAFGLEEIEQIEHEGHRWMFAEA